MIRSIYAKILLWFWVVAVGAATVVIIVADVSGSQPRASLWMSLATGVYAHGAVEEYLRGGKPALAHYMREIESSMEFGQLCSTHTIRIFSAKAFPPDPLTLYGDRGRQEKVNSGVASSTQKRRPSRPHGARSCWWPKYVPGQCWTIRA